MTSTEAKQAFRADLDDPRHGTSNGYTNLGCRCDRCCKARADVRVKERIVPAESAPRRSTSKLEKNTEWMNHAECAGSDPELFHPGRGETHELRAAKAVCAVCPVRVACLDYALTPPAEKQGVWGGLSERERRRIRRKRRAA